MSHKATLGTEDFSDLHERVLRFMGAFSSTQFAIDNVISLFLERELPQLGPVLARHLFHRIRDDQRLPLFMAFCAQVDYTVNLEHFAKIYCRAKQLKDMIGHSVDLSGPVYAPGRPPCVAVIRETSTKSDLVPDPLVPSTFDRFTADCEWISMHVYRAAYSAEPRSCPVDH